MTDMPKVPKRTNGRATVRAVKPMTAETARPANPRVKASTKGPACTLGSR